MTQDPDMRRHTMEALYGVAEEETHLEEFEKWIDSCVPSPYVRDAPLPEEVVDEIRERGYVVQVTRSDDKKHYLYYVG